MKFWHQSISKIHFPTIFYFFLFLTTVFSSLLLEFCFARGKLNFLFNFFFPYKQIKTDMKCFLLHCHRERHFSFLVCCFHRQDNFSFTYFAWIIFLEFGLFFSSSALRFYSSISNISISGLFFSFIFQFCSFISWIPHHVSWHLDSSIWCYASQVA